MPPVCFVMFQGSRTNAGFVFGRKVASCHDCARWATSSSTKTSSTTSSTAFPVSPTSPRTPSSTLDYLSPEAHLRGVYADVRRQFPRHALVAVGWSAGAHLAYGFAQLFCVKSFGALRSDVGVACRGACSPAVLQGHRRHSRAHSKGLLRVCSDACGKGRV